eukprot:scaffold207767_cov30-Tisochrysis_lutea.AAC.2
MCGAAPGNFAVLYPVIKVDKALQAKFVCDALRCIRAVDTGELSSHLASLAQEQHWSIANLNHGLDHGRVVGVQVRKERLKVDGRECAHVSVHELREMVGEIPATEEDDCALVVWQLGQQFSFILERHVAAVPTRHPPLSLLCTCLHLSEPVAS